MLISLLTAVLATPQPVAQVLEQYLRGLPLHGPRFQHGIVNAMQALHRSGSDSWLNAPIGAPSYRILTVDRHASAYLIHRVHGHTYVKSLPEPPDESRYYEYGLSQGHLLIIYSEGMSGQTLAGMVYASTPAGWKQLQTLREFNERSMQGFIGYDVRAVGSHPKVMEVTFTDHVASSGYFEGSHFAPGLKYRERWRFSHGVLQRRELKRLPTPMAALYDLRAAAFHGRKGELEAKVPTRFRTQLWNLLSGQRGLSINHDPKDDPIDDYDECRDLVVGGTVSIHFVNRGGQWVVGQIQDFH